MKGVSLSNIAILMGGPSPEHDISILTGLQVARELSRAGRKVTAVYWSKSGDWFVVPRDSEGKDFLEGVPKDADAVRLIADSSGGFVRKKSGTFGKSTALVFDVAVVCCHGGPGEVGSLQGTLDLAGITYTGPDAASAALAMDKLAFGGVVSAAGLPSLPRRLVTAATKTVDFEAPYILKPRFGGSSIGIEIVDSLDTAKALLSSSPHFRSGVVAEPYLPNSFDLNVSIRRYPKPELSALEKPVRSTSGSSILNYTDKYVGGDGMVSAPRELPADIPNELADAIRVAALQVGDLCNVRGVQRLDFLVDGDQFWVNEINPIPGSLAKYLWVEPAISFLTLIDDMIEEATARPSRIWTTSGADGTALRSAGNIAGKLT